MGSLNTKTIPDGPASENPRAEGESSPEIQRTQPASETPSDVSQMTAQAYCVEDSIQQPTQEGNEGHLPVLSEGMEGLGPQEGSESLAGTSGSAEAAYGTLEEGKIAPELMELIEKFMGESYAPSTQIDIVCQSCQGSQCLLGDSSESFTSTLEYELCSSLIPKLEPRTSKELSAAFLPPPVETLDSWDIIEAAKSGKGLRESCPDAPVAEVTGAQAVALATQQQSPESVCNTDAELQKVPAGEDVKVHAGTTEEEEEEADLGLFKGRGNSNRTAGGEKQENVAESSQPDPFYFLGGP